MINLLSTLSAIAEMAFAALLNSLWLSIALTAGVAIALKVVTRVNAATRYAVWWVVLAMTMVLPVVPHTPILQMAPTGTIVATRAEAATLLAVPEAAIALPRSSPAAWFPIELHNGVWLTGILLLWSSVFLLGCGQVLRSFRYLRGIKKRARPATAEQRRNFDSWVLACHVDRPVRLLLSAELATPIAIGFRHPAVIVPESLAGELPEADLDHVLLHELAHIARRDDWTNLVARLVGAVLALHPVTAWVLRRIAREREIACDDWVVSMTGDARSYAASLARVFELCCVQRHQILAAGMADHASHLRERVEMLLRAGREFAPNVSVRRLAAGALVLVVLIVAGGQMPPWIAFAQQPVTPVVRPERAVTSAVRFQRPATSVVSSEQQVSPAGSFLADLAARGYRNLSVDEIVQLKVAGVSGEFMDEMNRAGWGQLTVQQLVNLRVCDVSAAFLQEVKDFGFADISLEDAINLRVYGVGKGFIQDMQSRGFGRTVKEVVDFMVAGVDAAYLKRLEDAGLRNLTAEQIIQLRVSGVD